MLPGMALGRRRHFGRVEEAEIVDAIRRAEQGNRGEVRVHVEGACKGEPLDRAKQLFASMCMDETSGDTGVLLYVAVKSKRAAVWAGRGIHAAAADGVWQEAVDAIADGYRAGNGAAGVRAAVDKIGDLLREHVPGPDRAGNELPNEVTTS